jgi:hypothetical protein
MNAVAICLDSSLSIEAFGGEVFSSWRYIYWSRFHCREERVARMKGSKSRTSEPRYLLYDKADPRWCER